MDTTIPPGCDPAVLARMLRHLRKPLPSVGTRFGYLEVLPGVGYVVSRIPRLTIRCRCACGREVYVWLQYLRSGHAQTCGCRQFTTYQRPPRMIDSVLYTVWRGMLTRCYARTSPSYPAWGGRGITICDEWREHFRVFERWALDAGYQPGLSIDRIDNNGPYAPENCRWATPTQQARNTRRNRRLTAFGETKTVAEWTQDARCQINPGGLYARVERGEVGEAAVATPTAGVAQVAVTALGERKTLKAWARDARCCVSYKVLWQRLKYGVPPEEAITAKRAVYRQPFP